jgi:hypothetical protein
MAAKKKKGKKAARKAARKSPSKSVKARKAVKRPVKKAVKKAKPTATPREAAPAANPWVGYAARLGRESAITLKVMRAFPADQPNFQPHPRSASALRLFWTFAIEQGVAVEAIKGTLKMPPNFPPPPPTLAECTSTFERNVATVIAAANAARPSDHARLVPMFTGPGAMGEVPAGPIAELMLTDQIHHRGQLSVYVRMAGGKVPSIYGPSADEPW